MSITATVTDYTDYTFHYSAFLQQDQIPANGLQVKIYRKGDFVYSYSQPDQFFHQWLAYELPFFWFLALTIHTGPSTTDAICFALGKNKCSLIDGRTNSNHPLTISWAEAREYWIHNKYHYPVSANYFNSYHDDHLIPVYWLNLW